MFLESTIKMLWKVHQLDVKNTFFNWHIKEEVHVRQPQGFEAEC